ncbi:MAG: beta-propeller domain-containing protein, partial [Ilumatobacteraceae bacterium]
MRRETLTPLALMVGVMVAAAACTTDDPDSVSTGRDDPVQTAPPSTTATPSTLPGSATTDPSPARPQPFGSSRLGFFGDCPALLDYMQVEASARVTPWGLEGGFSPFPRLEGDVVFAEDAAAEAAPAVDQTGGNVGVDFSGTNTQEIGVDEGDIVETDGEYVYVANQDGLRIVSVEGARVVAEPELPFGTHQMLLDGDRLLIATSSWTGSADTIVSLYDVADPESPTLLRRSHLEGQLLASRSVDGVARLVVSTSFAQRLPFVQPSEFGLDEERALERNREIIDESSVEDWLPRWFDEAGDGG